MIENLNIIYTAIENISSKEFAKKINKEISALSNTYGTQEEIIIAGNVLELIKMGISEEEIYKAVQMQKKELFLTWIE